MRQKLLLFLFWGVYDNLEDEGLSKFSLLWFYKLKTSFPFFENFNYPDDFRTFSLFAEKFTTCPLFNKFNNQFSKLLKKLELGGKYIKKRSHKLIKTKRISHNLKPHHICSGSMRFK